MPSKSAVAVSSVGGSPGTQLAVDLDQRFFGLAHGVAAQGVGDDVAHVVALGEEDLDRGDAGLEDLVQLVGGELLVGLVEQLAGGQCRPRRTAVMAPSNSRGLDLDRRRSCAGAAA